MAGERGCLAIEGFDRGNSPQFHDDRDGAGELVLCTTNGTPALLCALSCAGEVPVGSLLNLDIDLCARESVSAIVPRAVAGSGGIAIVSALAPDRYLVMQTA